MYFEIKYVFVSHWQCIWMNIKLKVGQLGIKIDIFKPNVILVYLLVKMGKLINIIKVVYTCMIRGSYM